MCTSPRLSQSNLGLQLADIVANALCRALNGNVQLPGWELVSQLLIRKKTAPFTELGPTAGKHATLKPCAAMVWRKLDAKSKAMVLEPSGRYWVDFLNSYPFPSGRRLVFLA